ncbi:hypothetical protein BD560DRAFT_446294 [Blakeslea trispora]|nr:hypothetical protein BD560DRAFT_446294 [Blakeslea trispora]
MALSHKNSNPPTATTKSSGRRNNHPTWAQVAQRQTFSYKPAAKPRLSGSVPDASSSASKFASPDVDLLHECIRPFLQGLEDDSTLIDITNVRDPQELKQFFGSFNTDTYFPYFGTLLVERRYLQRRFIETFWDKSSAEYERLIGDGLQIDDGRLTKGYPSLPSDAKVARIKVERLPFINPLQLRDLMYKRFAHFGSVLNAGLQLDGKSFFGQGYVILDLNCPHPTEPESLRREIDWFDDGKRMLRLTWDEMPPYCRYCQKDDHCRADCQELLQLRQCYNCNELGHISRDCSRRNYGAQPPAGKRVAVSKAQMEKEVAAKAATRTEKLRKQRQKQAEEETQRVSVERTQVLFDLEDRIQQELASQEDDDIPDVPPTSFISGKKEMLEIETDRDYAMEEITDKSDFHQVSVTKKMKVTHAQTTTQSVAHTDDSSPGAVVLHL